MAKTTKFAKRRAEAAKLAGKHADKRRELAEHAISALGNLGYARTTLRDIASQSGVSLGILHYYFEDKVDLISYCVKLYKETFVALLDATLAAEIPSDAVPGKFIDGLVTAVAEHANIHRLWYDIRGQALFDEAFHSVVSEIEDALIGLAARLLGRLQVEGASPIRVCLGLDGIFRYCLQRRLSGDGDALAEFRAALAEQFAVLNARLDL